MKSPTTPMGPFRLRIFVASLALCVLATRPALAYHDDTHYGLTYYLARTCGYTQLQAHRLASACVRIDRDYDTEPTRFLETFLDPVHSVEEPRWRFHALMNSVQYPQCLTDPDQARAAEAAVRAQLQSLWSDAVQEGNPGKYFHFLQDTFSHRGYASWGGHYVPTWEQWRLGLHRQLVWGPNTDYLSHLDTRNPGRHEEMLWATVRDMRAYMAAVKTPQRPGPGPTKQQVEEVLTGLRKASGPEPPPLSDADLLLLLDAVGSPLISPEKIRAAERVLEVYHTPKYENYGPVIASALEEWGEALPVLLPPEPVEYDFDRTGKLEPPLVNLPPNWVVPDAVYNLVGREWNDRYVLYGNLRIVPHRYKTVSFEGGFTREEVPVSADVEVFAPPTRPREQRYRLGAGAAHSGEPLDLSRLPIGAIEVELTFTDEAGSQHTRTSGMLLNKLDNEMNVSL